ncbi:BTAD domain-containing putative transcriptional regulator [Streptomyces sp. AP-93]|uniref:BTAD domain-containing putative transcriptional regulator n=1 Tax=Streptomyces sp. AP-93 TaxID=2929048 RepID=UPI001FAF204D|nr:BTAD domain-containing putative transcriptional regulator [Streptomyces sp. AP-93]MCJ0871280.1 hypothetical protein [Streptomyces sp. AP-93]
MRRPGAPKKARCTFSTRPSRNRPACWTWSARGTRSCPSWTCTATPSRRPWSRSGSGLAGFTQAHPLREYGCELFSLALYRAGRQADALSVLRMHQRRMAEDLGISSSPALQRLEVEILRQAPTLD